MHVIYSTAVLQARCRITNIAKHANFSNYGVREVEFCSFHGRVDGDQKDIGFAVVCIVSVMQGIIPSDRIQHAT